MMSETDEDLTLRQVLLGRHGERDLHDAADETGATGAIEDRIVTVPPGLRVAVRDRVLELIAGALDERLVDVLTRGWQTWDRVAEAAKRSLETPDAEALVELLDHEVTSTHRPRVEVLFDGKRIAEIEVTLEAAITLHAVTAVFAQGRLTAMRTGRADLSAELAIEGVTVLTAARTLDLPIEIPVEPEVAILPPPPVVTVPEADQPATTS
jgi:hypothetical protein